MRNFEERMDAIRNRSKTRIAQRRRQISAVCVPLVLCIVFTGVYWGTIGRQTTDFSTQSTMISITLSSVVVTDSDSGQVLSRTDSQQALCSFISQLQVNAGRVQDHTGAAYSADETSVTTQNKTIYNITLTDEQGSIRTYTLCSGCLEDIDNGIIYKINSSQYQYILELLGLNE